MKIRLLAVSAALVSASTVALADTDNFSVTASVSSACEVTADDLNFGVVNVLSADEVQASSNISVTCTSDTDYNIGLSAGNSADVSARFMNDGAATPNELSYNLYQEVGRFTIWGDTDGVDTVAGIGSGGAISHTVYGTVPGAQNGLPAGAYSDLINVSIYY